MAARTAKGKLIKTRALLTVVLDADQGMPITATTTLEYVFQDDVRLVGCQVEVTADVDSALALMAGDFYVKGLLSLSGINPVDGVNLKDGAILQANVKAHVDTLGIVSGNMRDTQDIMFPEGYGIDFDYLEKVYLHCSGMNRMAATAGDMSFRAYAILYLVER